MADQVEICNVNNAFSVKEEECHNNDFVEAKFDTSETAVTDIPALQEHSLSNTMKLYNTSNTLDNIKTELLPSEVHYFMIHDNLKIEDRISPDHIKMESNDRLLYCEDCHVYYKDYCTKCGMLVHILNRTVVINAENLSQEELPNNILKLQDYFGEPHIIASKVIPVGVKFGPFTGLNRTEGPWKIKNGKFVVNNDKSTHLNWMQYINPARNISEQNLLVFQYNNNIYYQSISHIQESDELLVYFGEEYEDSMNRNVEMDFIPTTERVTKDAFACIFCCLGFSSKSYLVNHKTICPMNADGGFAIKELTQCPSCKIHFGQKEYLMYHVKANCCEKIDRKCDQTSQANRPNTRPRSIYKCQQCKYKTKYKGDLKNHTNLHYEVKMYKCEDCCRLFKTKEVLTRHVENTHDCAGGAQNLEHSTGVHTKTRTTKAEYSCSQNDTEQFQCSLCEFRTKYKQYLKRHLKTKHFKEFNYKCDICTYKTHQKHYLKTHLETIHLKEFKYKCETCDYKTNIKSHFKIHTETIHLEIFKYKCGTCDYKTNYVAALKIHINTRHLKEFKYKCDKCDYRTNFKFDLKKHVEGKHLKEFKYKCDKCEYKANQRFNLQRHVEARHLKELKYRCDKCDYKANQKSQLMTHTEKKHSKELK